MDRRTALVSLVGLAGAGVSTRWAGQRLATGTAAVGGLPAKALPAMRQPAVAGVAPVALAQIPLGGGGFVTGIDVSADGTRFACRTDVANAYLRDSGEAAWRQLFSPSTMLATDYDPLPALNGKADGQGVAGIRIAPSDKDVIYASYHGFVWKSVNGGRSVRRTKLPQKAMPSNAGDQRLINRTIDVHPRDPHQLFVGTCGEGAFFSTDGGDHWDRVGLPPAGTSLDGQPGIYMLLYDPDHAERVYVFVTGVGLYKSDSAPRGPFTLMPGGPTHCASLVAGNDETIYLCEKTTTDSGHIWRYHPRSGWASSKPGHEAVSLAVDPHRPERLALVNANGFFMKSLDGGQSFLSLGGAQWQKGGEVGWTSGLTTMFPAQIVFDRNVPDRLCVAQGVGVAMAKSVGGANRLIDWSAGIEELCIVSLLSPPGGSLIVSALDKPFWRVESLASYSNDFGYPVTANRQHSAALVAYASFTDFAGDDPRFLVGVVAPSDQSAPGFSPDGGRSWRAFEGIPASGWGIGGCIAASTKTNIILLPSNNGVGTFTVDGGKTWSQVRLDGTNPTSNFANAFYVTRKNLSADKTRPGTFALVYSVVNGNGYDNPLGGLWITRDGGRSWQQTLKGVIGPGNHDARAVRALGMEERQFWQCQLDYVPGRPRELVYSPHADYAADRFYWSQDDGATWIEAHHDIRNVKAFGFGKAAPGQLWPALYFWGSVAGKEGLFATLDWFQTKPRLVTRFPSQFLSPVSSIAGDSDHFGRVFIGTSCAGAIQADIIF